MLEINFLLFMEYNILSIFKQKKKWLILKYSNLSLNLISAL